MDGEERRCEEQSQEQSMRHVRRVIRLPSNAECGVGGMREPWGCWLTSQPDCRVSVAVVV